MDYILGVVIKSFKCPATEKLFGDERVPRFVNIQDTARRKLLMLAAAKLLSDLRVSPGNRLEKLTGNRNGQYGILINDQWRVCFVWHENDAHQVEIVDYH
jgi:proteic killer suppression protein